MIEKKYIITCDWCGNTELFCINKKAALDSYARRFWLYQLKPINPLADELYLNSKSYVSEYRMFCSENCIKEYFEENPKNLSHYKLVKITNKN